MGAAASSFYAEGQSVPGMRGQDLCLNSKFELKLSREQHLSHRDAASEGQDRP